MGIRKFLVVFFTLAASLAAQQPQAAPGTPLFGVNAKYANGVGPGYWPQAGAGLVLNVGKGTVNCANTIVAYAGGTLTMANNTTNYIYLDSASSCAPGSNTSGFTSATIPIAVVVTASGVITTITDDRTPFSSQVPGTDTLNGVAYPSSPSLHSVPVITATNVAMYKVLPNCPDSSGQHLNFNNSTDAWECGNSGAAPPNGTAAPTPRRWAYVTSATTSFNSPTALADQFVPNGCNAVFSPTSSFPIPTSTCATAATTGQAAGGGTSNGGWFAGNNLMATVKARLTPITNVRFWLGFLTVSQAANSTYAATATPAADYAAFRYDTSAGDTNFQCKSSGNTGSTVTSTNSGFAADTAFHTFKIVENSSTPSFLFYIDGSLVCTHTTNIPASGTALTVSMGGSTLANVVVSFYPAWFYEESDN